MKMKGLLKTGWAVMLMAGVSIQTIAAQGGNGDSPNGRPFLSLQAQIDETNAALEALAAENDARLVQLEIDVINLQDQIAELSDRVESNETAIISLQEDSIENADAIADLEAANEALQDQIGELDAALASKQDVLAGGCDPGSSLRVIEADGSFICEFDTITSRVSRLVRFSPYRYVPSPFNQTTIAVACPEGWLATGGGADQRTNTYRRMLSVNESRPYKSGWLVAASRSYGNGPNYVRAVVNCQRIYH